MPKLTRRKDTERPDRWNVFFGDVGVGEIGCRAGVPLHVDQWEWSCGFYPLSRRGISAGGTAQSFEQARDAFAAAWLALEPRIEETDYAENRRQRAWTSWKYQMHDASLPLPTDKNDRSSRLRHMGLARSGALARPTGVARRYWAESGRRAGCRQADAIDPQRTVHDRTHTGLEVNNK